MRTRKPTKVEKKWLDTICQFGCIVCFNQNFGYSPAAPHHLDGKTKKNCHFKSIPLCAQHHQIGGYGIAVHCGRVAFEKKYGSQSDLLKQITDIVGLVNNI